MCILFKKVFNCETDWKPAEIKYDYPISLWLSSLIIVIVVIAIILLLVGENFLGKWKVGGLGSVTFSLLVKFYQRILLIISNQMNHCDLSTVKDMWVIMGTSDFIASWLTKVFSKLSKGNLLFCRDQILSQPLKHGGVFKLLLARQGILRSSPKNVTCC